MWNLAHRDDCPPDTMDHALSAHIKILDYSCSQVYTCTCTLYTLYMYIVYVHACTFVNVHVRMCCIPTFLIFSLFHFFLHFPSLPPSPPSTPPPLPPFPPPSPQERESQKLHWLQRCVEDLSNEKWVIPALKHMKEICLLYLEVGRHDCRQTASGHGSDEPLIPGACYLFYVCMCNFFLSSPLPSLLSLPFSPLLSPSPPPPSSPLTSSLPLVSSELCPQSPSSEPVLLPQ